MAVFRNFDKGRKNRDPKDIGPSFELGGQKFQCLPKAPGAATQRLALAAVIDSRGRQKFNAPNVIGYIVDVLQDKKWEEAEPDAERDVDSDVLEGELVDETPDDEPAGRWVPADDRRRFEELLEDTDFLFDIEELGEIMSWLSEHYGERPTQRSGR